MVVNQGLWRDELARLTQLELRLEELGRRPSDQPTFGGAWRSTSTATPVVNAWTSFTLWDTVVDPPNGISLTGGVFTVSQPGVWLLVPGLRVANTTSLYVRVGVGDNAWGKDGADDTKNAQCCATPRLSAGDVFTVSYYCGTSTVWQPADAGNPGGTVPGFAAYKITD